MAGNLQNARSLPASTSYRVPSLTAVTHQPRRSTRATPLCSSRVASHRSILRAASTDAAVKPDPFATKETYNDSWLDLFFINYFSKKMSDVLGGVPYKQGFDGFVEVSKEIMKGRNSRQQQETVANVLASLLPKQAPEQFRKLFPFNKASAELNARITTIGFKWLVGPMELKAGEVEFNGKKEVWNSTVKIKKCRYLEESGCVGMCTNMCKLPTQNFFTNDFGLPLTMNPDFDDLSCEMIYGQVPPPLEEDKVYNQPCFVSQCTISEKVNVCPKLDTERNRKAVAK